MSKGFVNQTLVEQSDERTERDTGKKVAKFAGHVVNVGLLISAILTVVYLMLLVDDVIGLPSPYGMLFGFFVGVVAIVPAELALFVWRARLSAEVSITTAQKNIAVFAMIMAGLFSALTTSSFFSYFLPRLFPAGYMAIAPVLNTSAIIGSWVVFIMSVVAYSVSSRATRQNLAYADALQKIFDSKVDVLKSAGEAIREEVDTLIAEMNDDHVFHDDARALIVAELGLAEERIRFINPPQRADPLPTSERDVSSEGIPDNQPETIVFSAATNPAPVAVTDVDELVRFPAPQPVRDPKSHSVEVDAGGVWRTAVKGLDRTDALGIAQNYGMQGKESRVMDGDVVVIAYAPHPGLVQGTTPDGRPLL